MGLNIRPHLKEVLSSLSKIYEIIVFTAGQPHYADPILDYIDPERVFFQHRLYRKNCNLIDKGIFVKDLRILQNRQLKDIIIVDNSIISFAFQMENGIPILPF